MPAHTTTHLAVQALEARDVPTSHLVNGVLTVAGTDAADQIEIKRVMTPGTLLVRVTENGQSTDFLSYQVHRVRVFGNGGDDFISHNIGAVNARLFGGAGDDTIQGDDGRDYIRGGAGNDTLHGGAGSDTLVAGAGNDKLYGDDGDDYLHGGAGSDWLAAGSAAEPAYGGPGYDYNAHVWAYNGARSTDINQQSSRTGVFLSSLAGVAHTGHMNLARQITYVGDDTYSVRLFVNWAWEDVKVGFRGDLTSDAAGTYDCLSDREGEFWPLLYQRAYLRTIGYDPYSAASMATFAGEDNGNRALTEITGWDSQTSPVAGNLNLKTLRGLLLGGYAINSPYAGQEYAVTGVFQSGGNWYVRLYNPRGRDEVHNANRNPRPDAVNDGFMTITWASFTDNFEEYSDAGRGEVGPRAEPG